ncbi:MAG: twitching motility protein PilT [Clostridiales bacterium]|jgi:twitching motility protein PilT|nr:twitching motility protein PilT [Clostridiales bacterium]MDN5281647.1 twitching motility protein PilT [Candidatus Ozemobacter sp.]
MLRIHKYFDIAIERQASDLHLKAGSPPLIRVGGRLSALPEEPLAYQEMPNLFLPLMDVKSQGDLKATYETNFMARYKNRWRIRACIFRQRGCLSGTFRFIPQHAPSIDGLNLPSLLKEIAAKPRGLFLVTGPANSGKTHTLAAIVNEINRLMAKHIITIEDPIEFVHRPRKSIFTQREIGITANGYHSALMNALREDPDVILVGEMRDTHTIEMVLTAAETGHLVFSTLHTVGAVQTIDRIINVFPGHRHDEIRTQLSMSLIGMISQILLPSIHKKERIMAYELMIINAAMRNLIREKKTNQLKSSLMLARKEGCKTLRDSLTEILKDERVDGKLVSTLLKEIVE